MINKLLLSLLVCLPCCLQANAKVTSASFKARSVLAKDKWVKVGVEESGVYEISYETLYAMGFSDPAKVAIFGRGGAMQNTNFTNLTSDISFTDDLEPVPLVNDAESKKIFFYGVGVSRINFNVSTNYPETGGYFNRLDKNIYSNRGYYFLTDSLEPANMEIFSPSPYSYFAPVSKGVNYIYHEKDIYHTDSRSGQLFWGEHLGLPWNEGLEWDVIMPDAIPESTGVMQCDFYLQKYENIVPPGEVQYGFKGTDKFFSCPMAYSSSTYYNPFPNKEGKVGIPGAKGKVFVNFTNDDKWSFNVSNLDYWVVTYQCGIPTLKTPDGKSLNQQRFCALTGAGHSGGKITLDDYASLEVFDITNNDAPKRLQIDSHGNVKFAKSVTTASELIFFDKTRPQLQISGYDVAFSPVENQNLHALASNGADLVIITVPKFKEHAERLAEIHRQHDNISVVVATTEQCYNEFSSGTPDPMAYRTLLKMMYCSPVPPKSAILMGPLYADFRGVEVEKDPMEGIIAYQSNPVSRQHGAYNVNDFYGMMDDYLTSSYIERQNVHISIAILPFKFTTEADIYLSKVEKYLNRTDFAYYINKVINISGTGDKHAHDIQANEYQSYLNNLDFGTSIKTPLSIDSYGYNQAKRRFFSALNDGCNFMTYFGHAGEAYIDKTNEFFDANDVFMLRNDFTPLMGFGGCQVTNSDRGLRGLGETIVTATPYGCIGTIVSSRETWSGQNMEFFKLLGTLLYRDTPYSSQKPLFTPRTIGETYRLVKQHSEYSNELAYQLLCDPMLYIPTINRPITVDADEIIGIPGEMTTLTGFVQNDDGICDTNFQGEVVVRLMEPSKQITCGKLVSKTDPADLKFTYADTQVAMAVAKVENGKFEVKLPIPATSSCFIGQNANLHLCAYDPATHIGAGVGLTLAYTNNESGASSPEGSDKTAPSIEKFEFNPEKCGLDIQISDNYALNLSNNPLSKGFFLYLDGKEMLDALYVQPIMEHDRMAYSRFVPLHGLNYGSHTARVRVKDVAGNNREMEISFIYSPEQTQYSISYDKNSPNGTALIRIEGNVPEKARLVILDSNNQQIWHGEFTGSEMEWPLLNSNGYKVMPGHYKAYIIETGNGTSKGHSDTIDVPVI